MAVPMVLAVLQQEQEVLGHNEEGIGVEGDRIDRERVSSSCNITRTIRAAGVIQRFLRRRTIRTRLDHRNLTDRLLFEGEMTRGTIQLSLQIILFVFLVLASISFSRNTSAAGIYDEIQEAFNLQDLENVKTGEDFTSRVLPHIASRARHFAPLSDHYFQTGLDGGIELLTERARFELPRRLDAVDVNVRTESFTLTAWVKIDTRFVSGYILRKRVGQRGIAADLSCWGWWVSHFHGQQLHFGGHDYFPPKEECALFNKSASAHDRQVEVGPEHDVEIEPEQDVFLSLVVEQSNASSSDGYFGKVSFYHDAKLVGTRALTHALHNCFNGMEGPRVGDNALELAQVRFYPYAVSASQQREIMAYGDILINIVRGSTVPRLETDGSADENAQSLADRAEHADMKQRLQHLQKVADQQDTKDVTMSAAAGLTLGLTSTPQTQSPAPAAFGDIAANQTLVQDGSGRWFYRLFEGPSLLTTPSSQEMREGSGELQYRTLVNVPSFRGKALTVAWWHKHPTQEECLANDNPMCKVTILYAFAPSGETCWSFQVLPDSFFAFNPDGTGTRYHHSSSFMGDHHHLNAALEPKWRHVAISLDDRDDTLSIYLDGYLGWKGNWGSKVKDADCGAGREIAFGRRHPGWKDALPVGVLHLHWYVGQVLSEAEVWKLAHEEVVGLDEGDKCVYDQAVVDKQWKDEQGHDCAWFASHRHMSRSICKLAGPREMCPVACLAYQPCFVPKAQTKHFQLWHTTQTIKRKTLKGTICMDTEGGDFVERSRQLRLQCQDWVGRGMPAPHQQDWLINYRDSVGVRFDIFNASTVCDEVLEAVDPECGFESSQMRQFSENVARNGGDFSISFWYRPFDEKSMLDGRFLPHIAFYSSLFPPEHTMVLGVFKANPDGELRVHSACRDPNSQQLYESTYTSAASINGWTRFTYIRKNATKHPAKSEALVTNIGVQQRKAKVPMCFFDAASMFTAIEINYPLYMSPIELYPEALCIEQAQQIYYNMMEDMSARTGPERPLRKPARIKQIEFNKRSALLAPPILFQTRKDVQSCPFSYSDVWLREQAAFVENEVCGRHICEDIHPPVSCSGHSHGNVSNKTFFGNQLMDLGDEQGFADLLSSVTRYKQVYRQGRLMLSENFIDQQTSLIKVVLTFFAPETGVLALLVVYANVDRPDGVEAYYDLDFFNMLDGKLLAAYLAYDGFALVISAALMLRVAVYLAEFFNRCGRRDATVPAALSQSFISRKDQARPRSYKPPLMSSGSLVVELLFALIPTVAIAMRISTALHSSEETRHIIERWSHIEWDNENISSYDKEKDFFAGVQQIRNDIDYIEWESRLIFVTLIASMLRMLQMTSLHPRLALITGTLHFAAGHLMHAMLVALAVMCSFAAIGEWRFGIQRDDFTTFGDALSSEVKLFFSPDPFDEWHKDPELLVYTLLLLFMMSLLVLNFILAIIVESYMQVRSEIEKNQIEQSFPADLVSIMAAAAKGAYWRWPHPSQLGTVLDETYMVKNSIGYYELEKTGLFESHASLAAFLRFYERFPFLEPETITKYGKKPRTVEETVAVEVERRIAKLLGLEPLSLHHLAKRSPQQTAAKLESEDVDIIKGRAAMQQKRAVSDTAAASGRTSTYRSLVPAKTLSHGSKSLQSLPALVKQESSATLSTPGCGLAVSDLIRSLPGSVEERDLSGD